ncbi:hypothetical protein CNMCM8812_007002 [Aspergillus fumigatus]|nr:hypothetical protein CNMCM8812_007002 [Aspergillus fumigatus]KAH1516126.1 hypothetical protein KXX29_009321 [Aspergillus fumigatus]KAH1529225.1 hypothetical protein KXX18_008917 [Aspergillus fumigatus]KAH2241262.1 hypothetical protein KXW14_008551 [Aspergillus fumigatus]KAH2280595.1 hypothetical protein KXW96_003295 [Aspergillus fumigatus]
MDTPPEKDWIQLDHGQVRSGLGLVSSRTSERLNQVDRIRANGVGDHIALPQLVVCGDQSAGKSSVLEGISGIPFPRQDGVCTRFATEIILRHEPNHRRNTATILPHISRTEEEKAKLSAFRREVSDLAQLPGIIEEAARLMGVQGMNDLADAPTFAADVLRLEIVGDTGLHLTLVDLPGLISVSENDDDVQLVGDLVNSYLENSRSIILAVVPASSDVDTQSIIQRARRFDKDGFRTVGIITKPDLINDGTEGRIAKLANNADRTKLRLGFFLVKNPRPIDLEKGMTTAERRKVEAEFFAHPPWNKLGLDPSRVGIDNLRIFMQDLLDRHIERELPKVRKDVAQLLHDINKELMDLGDPRTSPAQIRMYLTRIATDFQNLVQAGVEGTYGNRDSFFHEIDDERDCHRLRAAIHAENGKFAAYMRRHGQKRKVISAELQEDTETETEAGQILVAKEQMSAWIKKIYDRTRGRELPGNGNHALLSELFHEQSSRWGDIARDHVNAITDLVYQFVQSACAFVIKDTNARQTISSIITEKLGDNAKGALHELSKLLADEAGYPITYNHYYTDNVQRARNNRWRQDLRTSLNNAITQDWNSRFHVNNSPDEISRLVTSLQNHHIIVDMEERACYEAEMDLDAYYKVARKTFVDNVCRQVIERHILTNLPTVFNPMTVSSFSDEDLVCLATESPRVSKRRVEATQLQKALADSLRELPSSTLASSSRTVISLAHSKKSKQTQTHGPPLGTSVLTRLRFSDASYTPSPASVVYRSDWDGNVANAENLWHDVAAAFNLALRWKISSDTTFADTASNILHAWATKLTALGGGDDKYLTAGLQGYQLANAAELLRDYEPFATKVLPSVIDMANTVFIPMHYKWLRHEEPSQHNILHFFANWELCNVASAMAMGVLTDNQTVWDFAVEYFKEGEGTGSIHNAITDIVEEPGTGAPLGQGQEAGRDQGHSALDVQLLAVVGQQAWNQGEDLFALNDSRILRGAEYWARYNLGHDDPFVPYSNGIVSFTELSSASRGAMRPTWELLYNHYVTIKGMDAPWTTKFLNESLNYYGGAEGGAGSWGEGSGHYDGLGWGSLLHRLDREDVAAQGSGANTLIASQMIKRPRSYRRVHLMQVARDPLAQTQLQCRRVSLAALLHLCLLLLRLCPERVLLHLLQTPNQPRVLLKPARSPVIEHTAIPTMGVNMDDAMRHNEPRIEGSSVHN